MVPLLRSAFLALMMLLLFSCAGDEAAKVVPEAKEPPERAAVSAAPAETQAMAGVFHFVDVAAAAGLDFVHVSGSLEKRQIYEANSGGVAWLDYDGDGWQDLYLVSGSRTLNAVAPEVPEAGGGRLYRNQGDGTFADVTMAAGIADWRWGMAAAVADYDNDGDADLYVTHLGANALWRNEGNGTFREIAAAAGVDDPGPGSGAAWGDIDGDGRLDLYVSNYTPVEPGKPLPRNDELCTYRGVPVFCGPKGLRPAPDRLYRSRPDGTFADVTATSGVGAVSPRYGFDVVFLDVDDDGDADIYVANDDSPSLLFFNDGTGRFTEGGLMAGVALSEAGLAQAGMGVDVADYDGDGLQDLIKTNFETESFNLYRNSPGGLFSDRAFHAGLAPTAGPLGFGALFLDADRDGILDIFFANGHVYAWLSHKPGPYRYAQANQIFRGSRQQGGVQFAEVSATAGPGLAQVTVSRGVAAADYDGDGDLDLAVNNMDGPPLLLRNDSTPLGDWLLVRTRGTTSNRDGYGARVTLSAGDRRQVREVRASRGYLSSSDAAVFFGVEPDSEPVFLQVRWPSGRHEQFPIEGLNRRLQVEEGKGTVLP